MKSRYLKILVSIAIFIPNLCSSLTEQNSQHMNSSIRINQSVYSIDKNLLNSGYKIENVDNRAVLMYHNKPMTAAEFYMPGFEGDKAIKLFIELKDTMRNAEIYLNDTALLQKTNKSGSAYIDLYRVKGKYYLKLANSTSQSTNNYYFELDKPLKLLCHGTPEFNCEKVYY